MVVRLVAVAVLAFVALIFGSVQVDGRDEVRSGVHAFGVDLGGMTRNEARAALQQSAAEQANRPLILRDGDHTWEISAAELGLTLDVEGALDDAWQQGREGVSRERVALLWNFRDATTVASDRISINGAVLDQQLAELSSEIQQERVDPELTLTTNGGPQYRSAVIGRTLDSATSRTTTLNALAEGERTVALTIIENHPTAYDEDYAIARKQLDVMWDAPVELVSNGEVWTLTPDQIAGWTTITQATAPGVPATISVDAGWLEAVTDEIALATNRLPVSPRVWWDNGGQLIVTKEGKQGAHLDWDPAIAVISNAFHGNTDANRYDLPVTMSGSPGLPADVASLGINTVLAEASTVYGGGIPERMHNIELAAEKLNGILIMPGQTFSFNAEVGPTTLDAGFQVAYGISSEGGELRTIPSEAGGICQVATTVFQPVFWTGYEIEQRSWHSYWIPKYAYNGYVGVDATVDELSGLDLKWTNNSPTAILLEASTDGQNFTVRLYGTYPPWRVEIDQPIISDTVPADPKTVYEATDTIPDGATRGIETAHEGFDSNVVRRVYEGDQVRTYEMRSHYGPSRNVVLVGSSTGELPADYQE